MLAGVLSNSSHTIEDFLNMTLPQMSVMLDGITRLGKGEVKDGKPSSVEDFVAAFGGKGR